MKHCWECRRRRLVCDSTRPACNRCRKNRVTCPGYTETKPLRWVSPPTLSTVGPARRQWGPAPNTLQVDEEDSAFLLDIHSVLPTQLKPVPVQDDNFKALQAVHYCKSSHPSLSAYSQSTTETQTATVVVTKLIGLFFLVNCRQLFRRAKLRRHTPAHPALGRGRDARPAASPDAPGSPPPSNMLGPRPPHMPVTQGCLPQRPRGRTIHILLPQRSGHPVPRRTDRQDRPRRPHCSHDISEHLHDH